jgi:hypothetical protein
VPFFAVALYSELFMWESEVKDETGTDGIKLLE